MHLCFIVNPASAHGRTRKVWARLEPEVARMGDYTAWFTQRPGHGTELARRAARAGFDRVVAMGGDGTMNEVGNGLVGTGIPMAIVPSGTGNDFSRTLGVPRNPVAAAQIAFGSPTRIADACQLDGGPHFFNITGIGFDAAVAHTQNSHHILKAIGGTVSTLAAVVLTLVRWRNVPVRLTIDGQLLERKILLIAMGKGRYYGGGMQVLPDSVLNDGFINLIIGGDVSKSGILGVLPKLYKGNHQDHPQVEFFRAKRVEIEAESSTLFHMDGDVYGSLPAAFTIRPQAISIVAPPNPSPGAWGPL